MSSQQIITTTTTIKDSYQALIEEVNKLLEHVHTHEILIKDKSLTDGETMALEYLLTNELLKEVNPNYFKLTSRGLYCVSTDGVEAYTNQDLLYKADCFLRVIGEYGSFTIDFELDFTEDLAFDRLLDHDLITRVGLKTYGIASKGCSVLRQGGVVRYVKKVEGQRNAYRRKKLRQKVVAIGKGFWKFLHNPYVVGVGILLIAYLVKLYLGIDLG